ncbi:MAG: protease adaptor protein RcdA [Alphaproteobacteria bacterium]
MAAELAEQDSFHGLTLQTFTSSALFSRTFDEGMALVEETAHYLDGRGRDEAKKLQRREQLVYASESMRVTTRLMQAASWLLVQRAVLEGDMTSEDAAAERYRLGQREHCLSRREDTGELPRKLVDLLERSESLYRRIARLDEVLFGCGQRSAGVLTHFRMLEQAFGRMGAR